MFLDFFKIWTSMPISSLKTFTKSPQQATDCNDQKLHQSLPNKITFFELTIKQSNYHLIGLCSNLIYNIFIFNQSYEDHSQNVSNKYWYFDDHTHTFNLQLVKATVNLEKLMARI